MPTWDNTGDKTCQCLTNKAGIGRIHHLYAAPCVCLQYSNALNSCQSGSNQRKCSFPLQQKPALTPGCAMEEVKSYAKMHIESSVLDSLVSARSAACLVQLLSRPRTCQKLSSLQTSCAMGVPIGNSIAVWGSHRPMIGWGDAVTSRMLEQPPEEPASVCRCSHYIASVDWPCSWATREALLGWVSAW